MWDGLFLALSSSLLLGVDAPSQFVDVTGVLASSSRSIRLGGGMNVIDVTGPPGFVVHGLLSRGPRMPDRLTRVQLGRSTASDVGFTLGSAAFGLTCPVDEQGLARLTVDLPAASSGNAAPVDVARLDAGLTFPLALTLTASEPGSTLVLVEARQLMLAVDAADSERAS